MSEVTFPLRQLRDAFFDTWRIDASTAAIRTLYSSMQSALGRHTFEEVMQAANRLMEGHGVEAIRIEGAHVDNFYGDVVATYVNMGDTYNLTIVHDSASNSFHLTTYGDWLEQNEHRYTPEAPCPNCGQMFPESELDADSSLCPECRDSRAREDDSRRSVIIGPTFELEIIAKDPAGPAVWVGTADWSLSPGQDRENPHLSVEVPGLRTLYTTAEMLRSSFGNRLHMGSLSWVEKLTVESVGRALVALDAFYEQLDTAAQEEIYRRGR